MLKLDNQSKVNTQVFISAIFKKLTISSNSRVNIDPEAEVDIDSESLLSVDGKLSISGSGSSVKVENGLILTIEDAIMAVENEVAITISQADKDIGSDKREIKSYNVNANSSVDDCPQLSISSNAEFYLDPEAELNFDFISLLAVDNGKISIGGSDSNLKVKDGSSLVIEATKIIIEKGISLDISKADDSFYNFKFDDNNILMHRENILKSGKIEFGEWKVSPVDFQGYPYIDEYYCCAFYGNKGLYFIFKEPSKIRILKIEKGIAIDTGIAINVPEDVAIWAYNINAYVDIDGNIIIQVAYGTNCKTFKNGVMIKDAKIGLSEIANTVLQEAISGRDGVIVTANPEKMDNVTIKEELVNDESQYASYYYDRSFLSPTFQKTFYNIYASAKNKQLSIANRLPNYIYSYKKVLYDVNGTRRTLEFVCQYNDWSKNRLDFNISGEISENNPYDPTYLDRGYYFLNDNLYYPDGNFLANYPSLDRCSQYIVTDDYIFGIYKGNYVRFSIQDGTKETVTADNISGEYLQLGYSCNYTPVVKLKLF